MCCVPRKRVVSKALERVKFFRRNSSLTVDAVEVDDRVIKTLKIRCRALASKRPLNQFHEKIKSETRLKQLYVKTCGILVTGFKV